MEKQPGDRKVHFNAFQVYPNNADNMYIIGGYERGSISVKIKHRQSQSVVTLQYMEGGYFHNFISSKVEIALFGDRTSIGLYMPNPSYGRRLAGGGEEFQTPTAKTLAIIPLPPVTAYIREHRALKIALFKTGFIPYSVFQDHFCIRDIRVATTSIVIKPKFEFKRACKQTQYPNAVAYSSGNSGRAMNSRSSRAGRQTAQNISRDLPVLPTEPDVVASQEGEDDETVFSESTVSSGELALTLVNPVQEPDAPPLIPDLLGPEILPPELNRTFPNIDSVSGKDVLIEGTIICLRTGKTVCTGSTSPDATLGGSHPAEIMFLPINSDAKLDFASDAIETVRAFNTGLVTATKAKTVFAPKASSILAPMAKHVIGNSASIIFSVNAEIVECQSSAAVVGNFGLRIDAKPYQDE